jgi:hypothetical protein
VVCTRKPIYVHQYASNNGNATHCAKSIVSAKILRAAERQSHRLHFSNLIPNSEFPSNEADEK